MIRVTRLDELRQTRAMLLRLLDDGKPSPPAVEGIDELSPDDVARLLVTCSTEVILHMIALIAEFDRQGAIDLDGPVVGCGAPAGSLVRQADDSAIWTGGGHALSGHALDAPAESQPQPTKTV